MTQDTSLATPNALQAARTLVQADFAKVNKLIRCQLHSDIQLINLIAEHIINSGGKRLRPLLVLLSANACGYKAEQHIELAVAIEFLHTATLLHDDVVDASDKRRGKPTANAIWGNEASVLVGDFVYSRAFELMTEVGNLDVLNVLAKATNVIASGEVLQLIHRHDATTTEAHYLQVIHHKTAMLFQAAVEIGALVSKVDSAKRKAISQYGMELGMAFQIIDDLLDYSGDISQTGKNIGDDLAEGKMTLPLLYVLQNGNEAEKSRVAQAIKTGGLDDFDQIKQAIDRTGALEYTRKMAHQHAQSAKQCLQSIDDNPHRQALIDLADFVVSRDN